MIASDSWSGISCRRADARVRNKNFYHRHRCRANNKRARSHLKFSLRTGYSSIRSKILTLSISLDASHRSPLVFVHVNFLALICAHEDNRFVYDSEHSRVDVVGVGLNATDTVIRLPHFPTLDSKLEILSAERRAGGQTASAIAACQRWALHTRYVGKIGDDEAGKFQREEMDREGVYAHWITAPGCMSQSAFILVDEKSGA